MPVISHSLPEPAENSACLGVSKLVRPFSSAAGAGEVNDFKDQDGEVGEKLQGCSLNLLFKLQ